ncbi:MAG: hypothetical protein WBO00_10245 [Steroidobacteraceae bacterium]
MTQRQLTWALSLTALFACSPAGAADDPLAPLAFLAGHCWITRFEDGRKSDMHCYEWMHDGKQLRDRHVVHGSEPAYRGETIYAWHGGRKRIEYRYWNSLGGQSDGHVEAGADGKLSFLDDRYVGPDGAEYTFASEMTRPGETQYRMASRYLDGETWKEAWTRVFDRTEAQAEAPQ